MVTSTGSFTDRIASFFAPQSVEEYFTDQPDRSNNLNLLRMVAALAVLASHTVLMTQGRDAVPPTMWLLGTIAVWAFFVISGFLISASFVRSRSVWEFSLKRILRIFPALVVCVFATAVLVGPVVTSLPVWAYFNSSETYRFIFGNMTLFGDYRGLPGVFAENPSSYAQVTFWTLKYEALCYLGLLGFGLIGIFNSRLNFTLFLACFAVVWVLLLQLREGAPGSLPEQIVSFHRLVVCFVLGMACYVYRSYVFVSGILAASLIAMTLITWFTPMFHILLPVTIAYCVMWFAFVPSGIVRSYNSVGDYSYGVYIFGVPVQQLCVLIFGDQTPLTNFAFAVPLTIVLAVLSWKYVEQPSLKYAAHRSQIA